ncbi:N-acetyllactosaminide beta-1,3-N-acetylglucosaminyltransferase 2-like [Rhincodon typus]|uniref:N-acetyllactosaminide beta-1,3-N-acetylglucosaminyltransferase 2-like n=1 Tax=Rhincodon typus TaxID=259920 RepID=UPI0009A46C6E|nr:N-acetyllactosaminide beta-1,3-N-acetylglucosaminyltransferase 2-like [Rhincodon typus]
MAHSKLRLAVMALLGLCMLHVLLSWHSKDLMQAPVQKVYVYNYSLNITNVSYPSLATNEREISLINISSSFRRFIPEKNSFWNHRQHQMLQLLDRLLLNGTSSYSPSSNCIEAGMGPAVLEAYSFSESHGDFLRYMNCKDYLQRINHPDKCDNSTFLLLVIKSIAANFERRQAIRETWGKEGTVDGVQVRTIFLLGSASNVGDGPDLWRLLELEDRLYGDLLQWEFKDTLFNLTLKDYLFLKWATVHCPHVRYIFKGDDDVFVNTPVMVAYLKSLSNKSSQLYVGQTIVNATPLRDKKSKYSVPKSFYDGAYPAYAGGGGFLYSGNLVRSLYIISHYIPFFPIDDVFTGMCFMALEVSSLHHPGFQTFDIEPKHRNNPCAHTKLILVHQRSPRQTTLLWRALHSPDLKC